VISYTLLAGLFLFVMVTVTLACYAFGNRADAARVHGASRRRQTAGRRATGRRDASRRIDGSGCAVLSGEEFQVVRSGIRTRAENYGAPGGEILEESDFSAVHREFECVAGTERARGGKLSRSGNFGGGVFRVGNGVSAPKPIFTPATKAEHGLHDENISFETMAKQVGLETATLLRERTLDVYRRASAYAESRGIILADTKFEWGRLPSGELILIDEVLTPDSSRFWPKDTYRPGSSPPSFDKQFVRDWLETTGWDKKSPPPELPPDVVEKTGAKYREALLRLTGSPGITVNTDC